MNPPGDAHLRTWTLRFMALLAAETQVQLAWLGERELETGSVVEEVELLCRISEGLAERGAFARLADSSSRRRAPGVNPCHAPSTRTRAATEHARPLSTPEPPVRLRRNRSPGTGRRPTGGPPRSGRRGAPRAAAGC